MGFLKWLSRAGAVGGTARWAADNYRLLRTQYPDHAQISDAEIFRLMVDARFSVLPNPLQRRFIEEWLVRPIGLRALVTAIVMAENNIFNFFEFPDTFKEVIDEELAKSGLPDSVLDVPMQF